MSELPDRFPRGWFVLGHKRDFETESTKTIYAFNRKLLVTKREFDKISGSIKQGGYTIIPLSLYFSDKGFAKLSCGIAKGKKKIDKRESIKQRDWNIKKQRLLKNN